MNGLSRRQYLLGSAAATTLAALTPGPRSGAPRPNILWLMAEDISPQLGCYGEPLVQTPNLDKLASEGARYTRAYTTAPVCSASRSAMATGVYQTTTGAHNHRTFKKKPLPGDVRLVTDRLRDAGYFTVLCGPDEGQRPKNGTGSTGAPKTDYNFAYPGKPFDGNNWNQAPKGKPWFAQLTIQESHKGIGWPLGRKLTPNIDQSKLKLPPYWPDHPVARDEYANYLEAIQLMDRYVGEVISRLEREGQLDNTLIFFIGDNGSCLFRGKQFLYEGGINVPMLVRWPGKVKPGTVNNDLVSTMDMVASTLTAAGVELPRNLHGRDFLNGAPKRTHIFAARDRCDTATERMRCVLDTRYKYIRNFLPAIPYMQWNPYKEKEYPTWNLVKQLHKEGKLNAVQSLFVADSKPVEEFYDLQSDPHEVNNLAGDPAHRERVTAMRKLLDEWIVESGDKGYLMEDPVEIYENYFKQPYSQGQKRRG